MRDSNDCKYLNDIKGCEVTAVYEYDNLIEIAYLKNGSQRTLTIEFYYYGGGMGYGAFFKFGGTELPVEFFRDPPRISTKILSEKFTDIKYVVEIKSYAHASYGYGDAEQLEIVYKDGEDNEQVYLLSANWGDDEMIEYDTRIQKNIRSAYETQVCDENIQMPQELFSIRVYKDVLAFALRAHGEQKTPSNLPYSFHIVSVATEIINAIAVEKIGYDEANIAIACALLHDVLEDTDTTMGTGSLNIPNIKIILQGVKALTKDATLPTKQVQMQDSLQRLNGQPKCVRMVKLADRITNLAPPPMWWNSAKREAYQNEAKEILEALKGTHGYLENKLKQKIDEYEHHILGKWQLNGEYEPYDYLVFPIKEQKKLTLKYLVLDKNHLKYEQCFKALNRLYEYLLKVYGMELFWKHPDDLVPYDNMTRREFDGVEKKVGMEYIVQQINSLNLLDLNKQIDGRIEGYMSVLYENEGCVL